MPEFFCRQFPVTDNRGIEGQQWAVVRDDGVIYCLVPNAVMQTLAPGGSLTTIRRDMSAFRAELIRALLAEAVRKGVDV
jgi:hypothetical protein